jgi:1-acyl-sn-glycerol-3-phosphate acyltransferase
LHFERPSDIFVFRGEDDLAKGTKRALLLGAVPFMMLVFALPFVNRVEPVVFGLPFVLFWILIWVALTPLVLFLASKVEKRYNPPDDEGPR